MFVVRLAVTFAVHICTANRTHNINKIKQNKSIRDGRQDRPARFAPKLLSLLHRGERTEKREAPPRVPSKRNRGDVSRTWAKGTIWEAVSSLLPAS